MDENNNRSNLVVGGLLVALGMLFFAALFFQQNLAMIGWDNLWPLIIVAVGALFFVGMLIGGRSTAGLAIPGSIIITVGLILLAQSTLNMFETWSYAWALIIVAVGVGQIIMGKWSGASEAVSSGWETMRVGAILFVIFGALMEFIFSFAGVSDRRLSFIFPTGLAMIGLALVIARLARLARAESDATRRDLDLFWPVLFLGLGLIWTLGSLGLFSEAPIMAMLNLWPLLLVAIGLNVILGRGRPWVGGLAATLLVAALLAFVVIGSSSALTERFPWLYNSVQMGFGGAMKMIVGEGEFATEERSVSGFKRVQLRGVGSLEVVQGEHESLSINAQKNLMPYIESRVIGDRLIVGAKEGYELKPDGVILYRLTVKDLRELEVDGAAQVNLAELRTDRLDMEINGSATVQAPGLSLNRLAIEIKGSGKVTAAGTVEQLDVNVSGACNFNGEDLKTRYASADISGLGQMVIWVTDTLDVNVSGSGSVSYYGQPLVNNDGGGNVTALGNK